MAKNYSEDVSGINWKQFYKQVLVLIIPMALQNLINVGVTAADVFMLGLVGETALSGASLAGQIQFVMTLVFMGVTSGATVLTAQYWGKGDCRTIEKILGMAFRIAFLVALFFAAAAFCIPDMLMRIYSSEPEVISGRCKIFKNRRCIISSDGIYTNLSEYYAKY